jgi:hypothetical protein
MVHSESLPFAAVTRSWHSVCSAPERVEQQLESPEQPVPPDDDTVLQVPDET